jgi:hypothetical protein
MTLVAALFLTFALLAGQHVLASAVAAAPAVQMTARAGYDGSG